MTLQKQKIYKTVLDRACRDFEASDQKGQVERGSLIFRSSGAKQVVEVPFFDETVLLTIPDFRFESEQRRNVTLASKILILHYLVKASGHPLSGEKVAYEDLSGCRSYLPVFERRVCRPLLTAFGFNRDLFHEAGTALGGTEEEYGNSSFTLKAFPMVPITFILWEGDQEFPPSIKVLFDRTIDGYLPLEDITVVSKLAANRLLHAARLQTIE
ncbi:MAG TPA: hypothetical protein DCR97_09285 [Deltaproteobacteria bacterium]|jgi:hypothetical protein|nr:hypothetical protein [Deltaproteobacteria bacterium]